MSSAHDPDITPDTEAIGQLIARTAQTVQAPPSLHAKVADERLRAGGTSSSSSPGRGRARLGGRLAPVLAGGVAVVALAVVLVLAGGSRGPTADDAVALALARPTAPAPARDPNAEQLTQARESGIQFPNYAWSWKGVNAKGARHGKVGGRHATTVTYDSPGGEVGYTIVGGEPLKFPERAKTIEAGGLRLASFRKDGANVIAWERNGHTCVLASKTAPTAQLVRMATYV